MKTRHFVRATTVLSLALFGWFSMPTVQGAAMQGAPRGHRGARDATPATRANDLVIWLRDIGHDPIAGVNMIVYRADGTAVQAIPQAPGLYYVQHAGRKARIDIPLRRPMSLKNEHLRGIELVLEDVDVTHVAIEIDLASGYVRSMRTKAAGRPGSQRNYSGAPVFDQCIEAGTVECGSSITFDNSANTTDVGDPAFSCHFGSPAQGVGTTWFKFVATENSAFLDTNDSAVSDTLLAVYDGTCGAPIELACSEDEGDGLLSELCVRGLDIGSEYLVQVASYSEASLGEITLSIECPGPCGPSIDDCEGAELVDCDSQVTFDNSLHTTDATDPAFSCHFGSPAQGVGTTWFRFVATNSSAFLDTNQSAVSDTLLAVYDGACGALVELACSEDEGVGLLSELCVTGLQIGAQYYVQVASFSAASQGEITLAITCPCPGMSENDNCDRAPELECNSDVTFDNSLNTTADTDPPFSCRIGGRAQGVGTTWYRFVATETSAFLDTNDSAVSDTLLAVYGGSCGSLVELACSDDEGVGLRSELCVEGLMVGAEYYVQVASYSESSLGEITLSLQCPCPGLIENDDCEDAELIPSLPASITLDNTFATDDVVPGQECGVASGPFRNLWYVVVGTGHTMTATTCNAGTMVSDTKISVLCGACDTPTCVGGNDDDCPGGGPVFASTVSWCSQPGVPYLVTVGDFSTNTVPGVIQLDVFDNGRPCSDPVQCQPEGACCLPDGSCVETTSGECAAQGGQYQGDGVPCPDAVAGGGFESGPFGGDWIETSTNFGTPVCSTATCGFGGGTGPRSGDYWCWFGGIAAPEDGSVQQDLVIPVGATALEFYLEIPITSGNGVDFMDVSIDGMSLYTALESDGPFMGYVPISIPLGGLADGGVHTLRFESTITGTRQGGPAFTNFFVDDVSILASCFEPCTVLDFELDEAGAPIPNGIVIDSQYAGLVAVTGTGSNYGPAAFDSTPGGPNAGGLDPDLLVDTGNVLILQSIPDQTSPPIFDEPDDSMYGGTLIFEFTLGVEVRRLDLIDIDLPEPVQDAVVSLIDGEGRMRVYDVPQGWTEDIMIDGPPGFRTLDTTTLAPQPGFLSTATATEDPGFDPFDVVRMEVFLSSSGAVDNIEVCSDLD